MFFAILLGLAVLGLGFWAYQENYRTRAALDHMHGVQRDIAGLKGQLTMLKAEWAYLNRPERLTALVNANNGQLQLMEMTPDNFGQLDQIAFPPKKSAQPDADDAAPPSSKTSSPAASAKATP